MILRIFDKLKVVFRLEGFEIIYCLDIHLGLVLQRFNQEDDLQLEDPVEMVKVHWVLKKTESITETRFEVGLPLKFEKGYHVVILCYKF